MLIRCSLCGKQDNHYTTDENTSIGCWEFKFPLMRKYICDSCIQQYKEDKLAIGTHPAMLPFEILG